MDGTKNAPTCGGEVQAAIDHAGIQLAARWSSARADGQQSRSSLVGLLTFQDSEGTRWRVWHVETPSARAHLMEASYRNGWLVFEREDGSERRRLAQVPEDWTHLTADHLARLCGVAVPAPPGRSIASLTTVKMPITPRPADFHTDR